MALDGFAIVHSSQNGNTTKIITGANIYQSWTWMIMAQACSAGLRKANRKEEHEKEGAILT